MAARFGKGAQLQYETTPASGTYQTVTGCRNITGPDEQISEIDVTDHDTVGNRRAFISGLQDPGQLQADVHFDPSDSTHQQLVTDKNAGTVRNWRVRWNIGGSFHHWKADGFVLQFAPSSPHDAALTASLTVRLTGGVTAVAE